MQAQDSGSVGSPDVELLVSPLVDVGTDTVTDVNRPVSPLPTVANLFVQDRLWAPVALPSPDVDDRRETPVPRWRLAREGPFLAERPPESIRSLGAGCAFRNMSYRSSDYDAPSGEFGLPVHHPRFLEWIRVPQSACLLDMGALGGWTICRVIRRLLPPCNNNGMWVSCRPTLTFWTSIHWRCRGRRRS